MPLPKRPYPPRELWVRGSEDLFVPAREVRDWAFDCFVSDSSPLHNPDHAHLVLAALKRITSRGVPVWGIRGHDVEEFVGVTARYGPEASAGKTLEFVRAASRKPLIAPADIRRMCGTADIKLAA